MTTPIFDFVTEYCRKSPARFHMPGHKGADTALNVEHLDITEIDGADNLWHPEKGGIIARSEENASQIFGCATFYSTEGSSLAIRGMLFLIKKWAHIHGKNASILAGRNAHKTFVNTAALLDIPVTYMWGAEDEECISCNITADDVERYICDGDKPTAVYITTPDYLGNIINIKAISRVCHKHGVFLLVDNAHGAYLKFLGMHPIDLGADMCCDSAHKTLPALTGAAYLHVSNDADVFFRDNAKSAMGMFGSTSPSYLILQSLDLCNKYTADNYLMELNMTSLRCLDLMSELTDIGYVIVGDEPLKITLDMNEYGYTGVETADILMNNNIHPEYSDDRYVVFMITPQTSDDDIDKLRRSLMEIEKRDPIQRKSSERGSGATSKAISVMSPWDAIMSDSEIIRTADSVGRILAEPALSCPPCVPEYMAGERIVSPPSDCEYVRVVKE